MAKVSAHGSHKVAGVRVDLPDDTSGPGHPWGQRYRYVQRSDGAILRSYQCCTRYPGQSPYWGSANYSILGRIKADKLAGFDLIEWVTKRHPTAERIVKDAN